MIGGTGVAYCYEDYVAHAEEAESMAERAKGEPAKASWLRIATGYRELAMMTHYTHRELNWHDCYS